MVQSFMLLTMQKKVGFNIYLYTNVLDAMIKDLRFSHRSLLDTSYSISLVTKKEEEIVYL